MNKKNQIFLMIIIILIILITGILLILNNNIKDKNTKKTLTPLIEDFYENVYYPTSNKRILEDFQNTGINISLEELIEIQEANINEYKIYDKNKSNITIYPEKPYKIKDYKFKIKLYKK